MGEDCTGRWGCGVLIDWEAPVPSLNIEIVGLH